ncbi:MAG: SMC-Scp complex subunit ScpB [Firmicutes bacterium]|jgi:segregation and condensation protein B|nr:SMC-Scp complex subunit ScpB [Bacillota bacterium]
MTASRSVKSAFEAMMFTWGEPLEAKTAADVLNITEKEALEAFEELKEEYEQEDRGIRIRRVNKSFQFVTDEQCAGYIERLCTPVKKRKLSQSALEVLAIVAYRQPVTRGEIEAVRGVKCERVLEGLMRKELVEEKGRSSGIGRPILYGTTDQFLKYFGFSTLKELPDIEDIESVIEVPEGYEEAILENQISIDDLGRQEEQQDS